MKVTKELIESHIYSVEYIDGQAQPGQTLTICKIRMINDFTVVGTSACIDHTNFNSEIGRQYAYEKAFEQLWALEGYHMAAERLNQAVMDDAQLDMAKRHGLKFGEAIEHMKAGGKVTRAGWNGKGMWVSLSNHAPTDRHVDAEQFWSDNNAAFAQSRGGVARVMPCFTMKTADDRILMGWLASQSDMLAEDWEIVL